MKLTEELCKLYFDRTEADIENVTPILTPDCVVLGSGYTSLYRSAREYLYALKEFTLNRKDVKFVVRDFWGEEHPVTGEVVIVYGGAKVVWDGSNTDIDIDMSIRFTIVFKKMEERWKISYVHQALLDRNNRSVDNMQAEELAGQLKKAQENILKMVELTKRDGLTGLANYRSLEESYRKWKLEQSWIVVVDLDNFKQINDTYGHAAGNHVLKKIANILEKSLWGEDMACRMGGDEFVILCGPLSRVELDQMLRKIQKAVAEGGVGEKAWTQLSVGATPMRKEESFTDALKRADEAMYYRKTHGKNGYCISV